MKLIHIQSHNRMFQTHLTPSPNLKKIQNYVFDLNKVLGVGNFSKVYHGSHQLTNQTYAIKVVEMERMKTGTLSNLLKSECEILQSLKHPNILNCIQIFNSKNNCYIVTELCNEGDLESLIRKRGALDQGSAKKIIYEIFSGLKYLNEMRIIHRDFKVANIFMNEGVAKIADFGFAKRLKYPEETFSDVNIGSPIYMAPESLLYHRYSAKTDVWAFGVFLYELLHGDTPLYFCKSEADLKMNIGIPIKQSAFNPKISHQLRNLIVRCLEVDEKRRISMAEMANHPYIAHLRGLFEQAQYNGMMLKVSQSTNANSVFVPELRSKITSNVGGGYHNQNEAVNIIPKYEPPSPSRLVSIQFPKDTSETKSPNRILRHKIEEPARTSTSDQYLNIRSKSLDRTPTTFQNLLQTKISTPVVPQHSQNYYTPNTTSTNIKPQHLTQPSQLNSISNNSNVTITPSAPQIQPTEIILSSLTFAQCVHILHYCRLVYKCISMAQKQNCYLESDTFLVNWLLSLLKQIKNKENSVRIEGDRASVREKKLKDVINEYQSKYVKELQHYIVKNPNVSPSFIRDKIKSQLVVLCQRYEIGGASDEVKKVVVYLDFLRECTEMLLDCVKGEDFGKFGVMKIEDFLSKVINVESVDFERIKGLAMLI